MTFVILHTALLLLATLVLSDTVAKPLFTLRYFSNDPNPASEAAVFLKQLGMLESVEVSGNSCSDQAGCNLLLIVGPEGKVKERLSLPVAPARVKSLLLQMIGE